MSLLSEVNPLAKIYHSNNLYKLIQRMESGLEEFKEKAPHRKDYINATEESIREMMVLLEWMEILYAEMERERGNLYRERVINLSLMADAKHFKSEADKLLKTLNFGEEEDVH